ncbi:hypothetical protein RchiOBHm_Chr5g0006141 [Rosa chinensis]|uniref:Uncharacterized protein n=1 Tax=Rosa chinensis TaxID=74649 RepID=A0A2P6Q3H0_ROSCH|nr:hypothetical protein RchiOBHm_Chr5g0006141 [Rosa chinensis]
MSYWRRDTLGTTITVESSRVDPAGVSSPKASKQRQYLTCSRRFNSPVEGGSAESERRKQAEAEESLHKVMYLNCWAQS